MAILFKNVWVAVGLQIRNIMELGSSPNEFHFAKAALMICMVYWKLYIIYNLASENVEMFE